MKIRSLIGALGTIGLFLACSPSNDAEAPVVGVNNVKKACEIRVSWQNRETDKCRNCIAIATNPECTCTDAQRAYAAKCNGHHVKRANEPSCKEVDNCVSTCNSDCNCIDACYAGKEACRPLGNALDGCVAEVCTSECK